MMRHCEECWENFETDSDGFMYISPVTWGVNDNGVVGYGRFVK